MKSRTRMAAVAALTAALSQFTATAEDIIWQGANYILENASTNISDAANWSAGRVPGPGDSVDFLFYGVSTNYKGHLYIKDSDIDFNPDGDLVFEANYGSGSWSGVAWNQHERIYVDKPLEVRSLKIATANSSSTQKDSRFQLDAIDNDGATLTLTGNGEVLDLRSAHWSAIRTLSDIILAGDHITFSDSARGGNIGASAEASMVFSCPTGVVQLGKREGGTLGLAGMGLKVHSGQVWTTQTNSYVSLTRDGTRSILDSLDGGRLDGLRGLNLRVGHTQYGAGSTLTLPGGTFGSLHASGGGSRTFRVTLEDDVTFDGAWSVETNGLYVAHGPLLTEGHCITILNGSLQTANNGYLLATNSAVYVGGNLISAGTGSNIGIHGDADTAVFVGGDVTHVGRSTSGVGLYRSMLGMVGGGRVQTYEVGDNAGLANVATATFAVDTLNVGFGGTNAFVRLVNEERNDNALVLTNATDQLGERLIVNTLNVNAGSTLDVNGQFVFINGALNVAPDAWLDLNPGRVPEYREIITNFVGIGNFADDWNRFADRVVDSARPSTRFAAVSTSPKINTPVGGRDMLEFDGINDYVKLSADGLGTGTIGTFTAELWLRVENTAFTDKWRYALHRSKDGDVGTSVYWIGVHGNDDASYGAAVNGKHTVGDTDVPIDNDWHHIALVYDGTTQFVYLDGELKKSGAVGAFNNTRTGNYYAIGSATYNATKRPFSGNIAEVRIWDHARTADQIQALMHTQLTGAEQGLANYWPLDGADGTVVEDKSPSGNDGTLVNGPVWASEKGFTYWQVVGPLPATLLILR